MSRQTSFHYTVLYQYPWIFISFFFGSVYLLILLIEKQQKKNQWAALMLHDARIEIERKFRKFELNWRSFHNNDTHEIEMDLILSFFTLLAPLIDFDLEKHSVSWCLRWYQLLFEHTTFESNTSRDTIEGL